MSRIAFFTLIGLSLLAFPVQAQISVLHGFPAGAGDGSTPNGSLILSGSTLYGMTTGGGTNSLGTIFKIETDGNEYSLLHSFAGGTGDGRHPDGSLVLSGTTLFGMTVGGGANNLGTIFKIETDGSNFALLRSFSSSDGNSPTGTLVLDGDMMYGMTQVGGVNDRGTIFRVRTNGSEFSVLHSFSANATDGRYPKGSLILDGAWLYGMTQYGGAFSYGLGTIFKIGTDGNDFTLLHSFAGGATDGQVPTGSLALSGTTLFGMTSQGGSASNAGIVFKIATDGGGYSMLHSFVGGTNDGAYPYGSLAISGSNLYGMTYNGGANNTGSLFMFKTADSVFSLLHSFVPGAGAGCSPKGSPIVSGSVLYGLTTVSGSNNNGAIFSFTPSMITVLTPNGGESWTAGDSRDITWASSGSVGNVDIIYSTDGGSSWTSIVTDTANSGLYAWSVPDTPSANCFVQVLDHSGSPYDRSDASFTIATTTIPSLALTSPNGGEHWTLGETRPIAWTATNYAGTVRLVLFKGGTRFGNIASGIDAAAGSYSWSVGQCIEGTATEGSDYRIYLRSTDNTIVDPSDYRFSLIAPAQLQVTSPNGGESWELGSQHAITWNANGYSGTVRLILFRKAGKIGQIAASIPAAQGSYLWTVGSFQGGTAPADILYSIRVLAGDGSQADFSDGPFAITWSGE